MGKGDRRSKRGKISLGSNGNARPNSKKVKKKKALAKKNKQEND